MTALSTRIAPTSPSARWGLLHLVDGLAWMAALAAATAVRLSIEPGDVRWRTLTVLVIVAFVLTVVIRQHPRLHPGRARRGSISDARATIAVWGVISILVMLSNYFILDRPVPTGAMALALPMALVGQLGFRLSWRALYDEVRKPSLASDKAKVIVFGAGEGGEQIIRAMQRDPDSSFIPVAVLDDTKNKVAIHGVPCEGGRGDLAAVARRHDASVLLIAIPSADAALVTELDQAGREAGLSIRVLPSTSELLGLLDIDLKDIRELTEADLLGRAEVEVDLESIRGYVTGKRVLVTGAGGSIGSELSRQLHSLKPAELFMLDRDESALHGLQLSIEGKALLDTPNLIVANIRDADRIDELFERHQFDVVFHTAALKHLTLLENHPEEAIKTNAWGTKNLLDAAMRHNVTRFVNVSTDKAADPTSMLGASKLLAERLTARAAETTQLPFVSVRFGNVLGSRGSVLPTFRAQIAKGGPITVTHPDVTRYFMTIPEAVRLVLQSGAIGEPGEIMILDMGKPVKIADLANQLIEQSGKKINIHYPGLRPGEKLHEILVAGSEIGVARQHPRVTHTSGSTSLDILPLVRSSETNLRLVGEFSTSVESLGAS